jgi:hypothetical protein
MNILGIPLTNLREIIILLFLIYIYYITNSFLLKIITIIVFIIHLIKFYINFNINYKLYKNNNKVLFYNLLLFISFIYYIKTGNYLFFFGLFIISRYIIQKKYLDKNYKNILNNAIIIFLSILGIIFNKDTKLNFIFYMEIINHMLI